MVTVLVTGCGPKPPIAPSTPVTPTGSTSLTISIVSSSGSQAFTPNPVTASVGQTVVFRNNSTGTHRIVADNGAWDTGSLGPGATSSNLTVAAVPLSFHCTIHASMTGTIAGS